MLRLGRHCVTLCAMPINQDPIFKLQEIVSHQEQEIERLSDALIAQQKQIDLLKAHMARMETQLQEQGIRRPDEETPPPHY